MQERIAKVGNALESIVSSLGRRNRELAVALLLELSKSDSVRQCIGNVKGCIIYLVTISNSDDNQAARDARELLQNLSFSDQNVILMAKTNYFKHLLERLSSGYSSNEISFELKILVICQYVMLFRDAHGSGCRILDRTRVGL